QEELEEARDKVMMGPERKSMFISDKEKEMTAYHEAGHALLGTLLPYTEPVHKVTIIPRGRALGLTQSLPVEDRHSYRKNYCLDRIVMSMGGYIAEELIFGDPSNGSSNDIQQATNIARRMVCEWGMSEKLGTIHYGSGETSPFMGRDYGHTSKPYSEEFAALIDQEVKRIIQTCLDKGRDLVKKNQKKLDSIAKALLAKETIDAQELMDIVQPSFDKFADSKSGLGSKKGKGASATKPAYSS
ncbi:cell division protein FtsH, partial [Leptospira sp. 201903075]|nr:cell division protein FtsH [Leptospira chreensis]